MPKPAPLHKYVNAFTGFYTKLGDVLRLEIGKQMQEGRTDIASIVNDVFAQYDVDTKIAQQLKTVIRSSIGKGIVGVSAVAEADRVGTAYSAMYGNVKKFSRLTTEVSGRTEIVSTIKDGFKQTQNWQKILRRVESTGSVKGNIAKDVSDLVRASRKAFAAAGDPVAYRKYKRSVEAVSARVEGLTDDRVTRLKSAYQKVIEATKKGQADAIQKSVEYAVKQKARYNAERIVRTEAAQAYGQTFYGELAQNDVAIGVKSTLSAGHNVTDVCDFYAKADLYGMGPGVFPKDNAPPYPYHPNCLCSLTIVAGEPKEISTAKSPDQRATNKYLDALPEAERVKMLGVEGAKQYARKKSTALDNMNGYEPPVNNLRG